MPKKKRKTQSIAEFVSEIDTLQEAIGDALESAEVEVWGETERLGARGAKPLRNMALYAFAHRRSPDVLRIASFNFGLSAGNMARAVSRHPEYFDGTIRASAPDLRMLFVLGQLNGSDDNKFFEYWRSHQTLQPWEMQRIVTLWKTRNAKPKAKKIKMRGRAIHKGRAGRENSVELVTPDKEALDDVVEGARYKVLLAPDTSREERNGNEGE